MNACARYETILEDLIAGVAKHAETAELLAHCDTCEACAELVALHRQLQGLGQSMPEPDEEQLAALTARVLSASRARRPRARAWYAAAALAASVLFFVCGLIVGRGAAGNDAPPLVDALGAEAASNHALADVENSRFTYSNVSLRGSGEGRVLLDFDVTTHVRREEPIGSELTHEVIVQALLDRSSTGARLRALSYAGASLEPKVREALLLSLRSDPSLAVRLKALELLAEQLAQPGVTEALLAVLRDDESVQMRLLALDSLAEHRVDRERIRDVIREGDHPGDEALLVRLAKNPGRL